VLMAADILLFNANKVPVGRDQIQHIEMARDIGQRFNHIYGGDYFTLPEAMIEDNVATLPGLDGRKMSKSYNNTIPLFEPAKKLRSAIMGIVTNSLEPGQPKNPDDSNIFSIYQAFAGADETAAMRKAFADGIGWGDAKQKLFERIDAEIAPMREKYDALINQPADIEDILHAGATRARGLATPFVGRLRFAAGLRALTVASHSGEKSQAEMDVAKQKPAFQQVVFREGAGFAFKILDATKNVLIEKQGFSDAREAASAAKAAIETFEQQASTSS